MTSIRTLVYCLTAVVLATTASGQVYLSASPNQLVFSAAPGSTPQALYLDVTATSPVDFSVSWPVTVGWLTVAPTGGRTPQRLFVAFWPGALSAGSYSTTITVTATGVANSPLQVPVTMNLGTGTSTQLSATPNPLPSFTYVMGGQVPQAQNLLVTSTTASQVNFTASVSTAAGTNWLTLNASSGTTPVNLTVGVNPAGLAPGTHSGTITLTPTGAIGGVLQVQVTLTVSGTPQLSASPSSVTFQFQIGQAQPGQKIVTLSSGGVPVTFGAVPETTTGGSWLVVSPNVGATATDLTVAVNTAVLAVLPVGQYQGKITVTSPQASNSPLVIPVALLVSTNPFLTATPETLAFEMPPAGPLPASKNLSVGSTGTALPFSVTATTTTPSGVNWLSVNVPGAITPATVAVSINSAAQTLPPGIYNGAVTLTATTFGIPAVTVPVTLTVSGTPALTLSPPSLVFNYQAGKAPPAIQTVEVKSTGVPVNFMAAVTPGTGGNWLQISATIGTTPATISLGANPAGLAAGSYQSSVTFTPTSGGGAQTLQATLNVSNTPLMNVSPTTLAFDFVLGASAPKIKEVALTSTGDPLNFTVELTTASGGSNWIAVTPSGGSTPVNVTVFVTAASLPLGTYSGTITVKATGANTQTIPVTVTVTSGVNLTATPASLTFSQAMGGTAAPAQRLSLATTGTSVRYTATATTSLTPGWLSVSPATGSTPADLSVTVDGSRIPQPGTYYGSITIVSPEVANSPVNVPVTFTLTAPQTIALSPATLQFSHQVNSPVAGGQRVTVTSTGGSLSFTAAATTETGGSWLAVSPGAGSTTADLTVTITPAGLQPGTYTGAITVGSPNANNSPQRVTVTLTVTAAPQPQPSITAVANAASYARGALAVGEIVYLEGTNLGPPALTTLRLTGGLVDSFLADTRILFDGLPAPLIYVSNTKSSAVVPYALFGRASTRVQVEYQGVRSNPVEFRLAESAPGLFALDATGQGPGAILNQDYSVNRPPNPAPKGSVVMLYGTGVGQLMPPVLDGSVTPTTLPLPAPLLPVTVQIGGRPAQVLYAGPAPGFVAGVLQVNVRIAEDFPSGAAVPVVITVGGNASQAGLTLAVR